ncbi:MAG TPA: sulfurtransferase [Verrucomicrobiae bacterium]|nr:sulfurtransferase [Verrucomicrobiae bacterium]
MRVAKVVLFLALPALPGSILACGGHGTADTLVVSTTWLAAHLNDPNLVVLAVGDKADYDAGHIAGSRYVEYKEVAAKGENGLSAELPPMPRLAEIFSRLGVGNNSRVVVYRLKDTLTQAARVVVTLDAMGMGPNSSLLDGNLATWTGEGRALSTAVPAVQPGKLEPCPQNDVIAGLAFVRGNLQQSGVRILDARAPEFYSGSTTRPGLTPGHIQGAGNVYYNGLFDESGRLKPAAQLQEQFRAAGVKPGDRVVTYCFIGQQASALYLVSRYLGYDTRLYDGSWEEWSKHPELPTATGSK